MQKKKFAIIGCGNVAPTYLYVLGQNPNAEVVALADPNLEILNERAKTFEIQDTYTDYKEMLESRKDLEAVVISTPHFLHHEQTLECVRRGLDILCEKPLATNMKDIYEMIDTCNKHGVTFSTMLQRSVYPNTIATKDVVAKRLLGNLETVNLDFNCYKKPEFFQGWRASKESGGGVFLSQTLHRVCQLVDIFGLPEFVQGITKTTRDYLEVEDYVKGQIGFKGVVVDVEANNSYIGPENKDTISEISIIGKKGKIVLSDDLVPVWDVRSRDRPTDANIKAIPTEHRPEYYGPCHEILINDFVDAILNNREPTIKAEDSIPAMQVIFGMYESSRLGGKRIKLTTTLSNP